MKQDSEYVTRMRFDPERLLHEYQQLEQDIPKTLYNDIQNGKRYGWALYSRTGETDDIHGRRYRKYNNEAEFVKQTDAMRGYFCEVFNELETLIGPIYRARIITLRGFRKIAPHHDGHDGTKFFRYHIPIIPNESCEFMAEGNKFVMAEAGRLYLFPAWEEHSVVNHSGLRSHLMFSSYKNINFIDA